MTAQNAEINSASSLYLWGKVLLSQQQLIRAYLPYLCKKLDYETSIHLPVM